MQPVRFIAIALALLAIAAPASSQTPAAPPPAAAPPIPTADAPRPATVKVSIVTTAGPILIELEKERAPITTGNFLRYVDQKRFDGTSFYRAVTVPGVADSGLVQGGVNNDPKRLFPPIAHEPTTKTGLAHIDGTISMGRNAPGTAAGDFFFTIGAMPYMDADPAKPGDNLGYAAFGHVIDGMDVLKTILAAPRSPTKGEGLMRGQMLAAPITIISVRRVPVAPVKPATPLKPATPVKPVTPSKP